MGALAILVRWVVRPATLILLVICASSCSAYADDAVLGPSALGWATPTGEPAPQADDRKSVGAFSVAIFFTDPGVFDRWSHPSCVFDFQRLSFATQGEIVYLAISFGNPGVSPTGVADVVFRAVLQTEDGRPAQEHTGPVWDRSPPPPNTLELGLGFLKIDTATEPLGRLVVHVTIHDRVSDVEIPLSSTLTIRAKPQALPPNKPLKLAAEPGAATAVWCQSGFPGVGRPW